MSERTIPRGRTGASLAADDAAEADRVLRRWIVWEDGEPIAAADLALWPGGGHQLGFYGPWDDDRARALLAAVEDDARRRGVPEIRVGARGESGCAWCRATGFTLVEEGIRFVRTLADFDPERDRKVYDLDLALRRDVPGDEAWSWSFEDFWNNNTGDSAFDPELYLILEAGDGRYIGLHRVRVNPDGPAIGLTGVLPQWRRCGAGRTLKVEGLRRLKARGFASVTTSNDAANAPILRLNERLGFVEIGRNSQWSKTVPAGDTVR